MMNNIKLTEIRGINNTINMKDINKNEKEKHSFRELLVEELQKVNSLQKNSEYLNNKLILGEVENIHQVMIAAEKADLALQLTLQIRNKILDAYNEIMRMQI
ncbi:Flagellar hook-basal body complex protein FliE [Koleobacter methoxysyntrophicus]|uniref:Flagellar hook-basal body complex protein FliE n=1 Tax=Koleobacter methoxysyntrophicus TaxID=2751313 RepID=A0A8A0RQQ9_9FIRM|nr:flagellar hook-basal body complex protein FliE [Koleobacter methoxysyntrophicus]MDI3540546.1 flagellar hook-basal body complex protein FliE [Thermosediminibacterales bacterium]MDK2901249.1 flagellar hook-basal body complex protein FliE [Thermosediminibacterales bacterium]QSQ09878.1 Flagellar hook-basal body complex protein FliE [Koleobacter methoxysyntrophicus]